MILTIEQFKHKIPTASNGAMLAIRGSKFWLLEDVKPQSRMAASVSGVVSRALFLKRPIMDRYTGWRD